MSASNYQGGASASQGSVSGYQGDYSAYLGGASGGNQRGASNYPVGGSLGNFLRPSSMSAAASMHSGSVGGYRQSSNHARDSPLSHSGTSQYDNWGTGGSNSTNGGDDTKGDIFSMAGMFSSCEVGENPKSGRDEKAPQKSQITRVKMIYRHRFGEFGSADGQFTEPSGVAVNRNGDILVADTNNHRIQVSCLAIV